MNALKITLAWIVLLLLGMASQLPAHGADVLQSVIWRRAAIGLPPFQHDPQLTALAEREALAQARRGRMGHIHGTSGGARAAGVGYTSRRDSTGRWFQACYCVTRKYRFAGAAAVVGRDGRTYYALMLR